MREDTSGLMLTEYESGTIRLEVVDYGISEFDGCDLEMWFTVNKENTDKLKSVLKKLHKGTFEEMLVAEFGKELNINKFREFCHDNEIKYEFSTWRSSD